MSVSSTCHGHMPPKESMGNIADIEIQEEMHLLEFQLYPNILHKNNVIE